MNLENKASGIIFAVGQNSSMPPENDNRCNGCPLWNSTAFFLTPFKSGCFSVSDASGRAIAAVFCQLINETGYRNFSVCFCGTFM